MNIKFVEHQNDGVFDLGYREWFKDDQTQVRKHSLPSFSVDSANFVGADSPKTCFSSRRRENIRIDDPFNHLRHMIGGARKHKTAPPDLHCSPGGICTHGKLLLFVTVVLFARAHPG